MLSNLRTGSPVYVLFKNEPRFAAGKVLSVSNQYPQFNLQTPLNPGNGPVIDLAIEIDGKTETFHRIPLNSSIAEFPEKGAVISETREGIINEIGAIRSASETALGQVDAHKRVISECDKLLVELNPQLKKEKEQADEIASLKNQLSTMAGQLENLTGLLSKSLGKKLKEE